MVRGGAIERFKCSVPDRCNIVARCRTVAVEALALLDVRVTSHSSRVAQLLRARISDQTRGAGS
jgi:hypothetical protein